MRLEELRLLAFGPFSGQRLTFASQGNKVHVVYGRNEAGKSSTLRALRDALYGIPHSSRDNFQHEYQSMRIGITLRGSDGSRLAFTRKKGNRNTLLHPESEEPIADALLEQLLSGITRDTYERMFGLDHAMLTEGGRELAAMEGHVGETLFSAATGVSCLRTLQQDLETEAAALFAPRGQRALNKALTEYSDLKKRLRSEQLSSRDYATKHTALRTLESELDQLTRKIAQLSADADRCRRLKDSLPLLTLLQRTTDELNAHQSTHLLRPSFGDDVRRALEAFTRAEVQLSSDRRVLHDVDRTLAECPQPTVQRDSWHLATGLADKVGAHRKALSDQIALRRRAEAKKQDIESHFQRLRPQVAVHEYHRLRVDAPTSMLIQEIGNRLTAERVRRDDDLADLSKAQKASRDAETALATAPLPLDTTALQLAIDHAGSRGDSDSQIRQLKKDSKLRLEGITSDLARAGRWSGAPEAIATLPLPTAETLTLHDTRLSQAATNVLQSRQAVSDLEAELRRASDDLHSLLATEGELPTEADIGATRQQRDELWQAIQDSWIHGVDVRPPLNGLATEYPTDRQGVGSAYENKVRMADDVADRIRLEHTRVAQRARLCIDQERLKRDIAAARTFLEQAVRDDSQHTREWEAIWSSVGVTPGSPGEMREWLSGIRDVRSELTALTAMRSDLEELESFVRAAHKRISAQITTLDPAVVEIPESLTDAIAIGRALITEQTRRKEHRSGLASTAASAAIQEKELTDSLTSLNGSLAELEAEWGAAVAPLGLPPKSSVAEASAVIAAWNEAYSLAHELYGNEGQYQRIRHIEEDLGRFVADVTRAAEQVHRHHAVIVAESAADVASEIIDSIQDSKLANERTQDAQKHKQAAEEKVRGSDSELNAATTRLSVLMTEAGVESRDDLLKQFDASEDRRRIEKQRNDIETALLALAADTPVDKWAAEAGDHTSEGLTGRLSELEADIRQRDQQRQQFATDKGRLTNELNQFGSGDDAITITSRMEAELANIESLFREFAQLRVSAAVLRKAIERFGDQNKGELLGKAGEFFAILTKGSYSGLVIDYDDNRPLIAGRSAGAAAPRRVEAMSEGTADQLYLALRLAYLSSWAEKHEPLPLILDDVLMAFDDDRAAAAMHAFASLAPKTQIILFTHHRHIVDLARAHLPESLLDVLELNA